MFNRQYLKAAAKQRMSGRMGIAIAAAVIALLLGSGRTGTVTGFSVEFEDGQAYFGPGKFFNYPLVSFAVLIIAALAAFYYILVGNVITIGSKGWFLRYWRGESPPVSDVFAGFSSYYSSFVTTGLLKGIYVFLWSLLFIIPGIVMGYAYSMADYIICEYPHLTASRALELSRRITYGYKAELFVFDLSFLGWSLAAAVTCGVLGIAYVNPYYSTAHAGVYDTLKFNAFQRGAVRPEDFGMIPTQYGY